MNKGEGSHLSSFCGHSSASMLVAPWIPRLWSELPDFPPLPAPLQAVTPVQTSPPPAPRTPSPHRSSKPCHSSLSAPTAPTPALGSAQSGAGQSAGGKTSSNPPPAESLSNSTNAIPTNAAPPKIAETQTNVPAPLSEDHTGLSRKGVLVVGAGLLAAAVALVILALVRSRRTSRGSLITRSMNED